MVQAGDRRSRRSPARTSRCATRSRSCRARSQTTRTTLADVDPLANALGPTATALMPTARKLPTTLRDTQTLFQGAALLPLKEIPPFVKAVLPLAAQLPALTQRPRTQAVPALIKLVQGARLRDQRARLQPGRQEPGLPVLARVVRPQRRLVHLDRRRQRARRGAALLADLAARALKTFAARAAARARCSGRTSDAERELMVTQAPKRSAVLAAVAFTLSCIGLMIFVWTQFGGTIPFAPQGYRVNALFTETGLLVPNADVRISGVNVGKVTAVQARGRQLAT